MGFCLLVAMMSGSNPPVTNLMPVLNSPLLCLHVAVIMMSYALFFFLMLIGVAGLLCGKKTLNFQFSIFNLAKRLLYPAVFLLALGIVIGALWANISWGNYWSWDPKEVWALITMLIYAAPLHGSIWKSFKKPLFFHFYCIFAFLSVVITYFGVNLILGGVHAYN
jgi:ABC-type transport system involved in cytochrome c biogenesis permease subunit